MYIFGKTRPLEGLTDLKTILADAREKAFTQALCVENGGVPISNIIDTLDDVSRVWQRGGDYWNKAFEIAKRELSFSEEMVAASLSVVPEICSAKNIRKRLKADFERQDYLDSFVESAHFDGRIRAFPLGVLYHVSAGNVFLGVIDSLIMGFITKNISIIKLSRKNLHFPVLFAESIAQVDRNRVLSDKFALLNFPGGSADFEDELKQNSNAIMAWGGEEMIASYKRSLPIGVKFIEYGPKISFQVLGKSGVDEMGIEQASALVARDVAMWDQAACASPQNLFVEEGVDVKRLCDSISHKLETFIFKRGHISPDEWVEIRKEEARGEYSAVIEGGSVVSAKTSLVVFEPSGGMRSSALNRSLIVKTFKDSRDLVAKVTSHRRYLQSCGYDFGSDQKLEHEVLSSLGALGAMRFAKLGSVLEAPVGAPHDGKLTLLELVRMIPDERNYSLDDLARSACREVSFYRDLVKLWDPAKAGAFTDSFFESMPLTDPSSFACKDLDDLDKLTRHDVQGRLIFSSGGTSGAPKYTCYSHQEFNQVSDMLSLGFRAQGMTAKDVVANFFVAGNLWSSFLAVDRALAGVGCTVLPIGGLTNKDMALEYLKMFRATYLVGLPTQIVDLAKYAQNAGMQLTIPNVLYAGEHLSLIAKKFLKDVFNCSYFGSAGYASVDAGPIGYQCRASSKGVHHIYDDIHLERVNGEAIVTSLVKRLSPVIRLKTGDLIDWVGCDSNDEKSSSVSSIKLWSRCECGVSGPRFILKGRANSQMNIWSSRIFIEEIEKSLLDMGIEGGVFQIVLSTDQKANDHLAVHLEHQNYIDDSSRTIDWQNQLAEYFYNHSHDLKATRSLSELKSSFKLVLRAPGSIERVARTGKVKLVLDER